MHKKPCGERKGALKLGSICAGVGGLDLALEALGYQTVWQIENDPYASAVLAKHWPGVPNYGDLTSVDWSSVAAVDAVCAGYPCQPFSLSGKRKGHDDERHLWPYIANGLRVLRPRNVFLENVPGHLTLGLDRVICDLAAMGYMGRYGIVRASEIGAPHQRRRLFLVATYTDGKRSNGGGEGNETTGRPESSNRNRHTHTHTHTVIVLLPTPTANIATNGGSQSPAKRKAGGHSVSIQDVIEHLGESTNRRFVGGKK